MWARFLVDLLPHWPSSTTRYVRSIEVMNALRMRKDAAEIAALAAAGAAVDRIAAELQAGEIPLVGRTEAEVSADLGARILAEGHQRVNFAIVAAGENAASPHHHAGDRVIHDGEIVLCDFGGTMDGYCSDITRCVFLGDPPAEVAEAYAVLHEAQRAAVLAGIVGTPCEEVDRVARRIIAAAGYGEYFIHRTGHGIGMEEHEDPYMVEGNGLPLEPGHAFSVEPGIYLAGPLGHAARGHRRRHRRRTAGRERRRPRPGQRRSLSVVTSRSCVNSDSSTAGVNCGEVDRHGSRRRGEPAGRSVSAQNVDDAAGHGHVDARRRLAGDLLGVGDRLRRCGRPRVRRNRLAASAA